MSKFIIILIADSTSIYPCASTKPAKQPEGTWLFSDPALKFGRAHHRYKYPAGYRAHSLITITGIPMVSIVASCNIHGQYYIIPLLDEFRQLFPDIKIAYVILDSGYDNEYIYRIAYESYDIIPVIVRSKMVYSRKFHKMAAPCVRLGFL